MVKVREYITRDGRSPYKKWFGSLDPVAAAKVTVAVVKMELGNTSNIKWIGGIGEYRIDWGPGFRIYLMMEGQQLILLLGGGTKKRQALDIAQAKVLRNEYKQRKKSKHSGGS